MDVVVTVPKWFGLKQWIEEGDVAGDKYTGQLWDFYCGGGKPDIKVGERVYVVCEGKLRGYAPLVKLEWNGSRGSFVRGGNAVAVTVKSHVTGLGIANFIGFRGWRYRWWRYEDEIPFPNWRIA